MNQVGHPVQPARAVRSITIDKLPLLYSLLSTHLYTGCVRAVISRSNATDLDDMEPTLENVRERRLHNNEVYTINLGEKICMILEEGIVQEESLLQKDQHALGMYRNVHDDKTEQHDITNKLVVCNHCTRTFKWKCQMLRHMREVHENKRIHECDTCHKWFKRQWTKNRHAVKCNENASKQVSSYTFPSCLRGYHVYKKNWTPVVGDESLVCVTEPNNKFDETAVAVMHNKLIMAGHVPRKLSGAFTKFLTSGGTITAKVADSVIDRGLGLEVPVDYIFSGMKQSLCDLIENIGKCLM